VGLDIEIRRVTGTLITIYSEIEAETALISPPLRPFIAARVAVRVNFNINLTCCAWRQDHRNHSDSSSSSKILGTYHLRNDYHHRMDQVLGLPFCLYALVQ
jgi:hypothetical protein